MSEQPTKAQVKECPHKTIRDWPDCYEDCDFAGTDECINHKHSTASEQQIEELIERSAKKLCESDGHTWGLTSIPFMHKKYINKAKQILFGNGLYLKVKCPHCKWSEFKNEAVVMALCYYCNSTGYVYILLEEVEK